MQAPTADTSASLQPSVMTLSGVSAIDSAPALQDQDTLAIRPWLENDTTQGKIDALSDHVAAISTAGPAASVSPLDKGVVAAPAVTGVEATVPPPLPVQTVAPSVTAATSVAKPAPPTPADQLTNPLTGELLAEDMVLAQVNIEGDDPPPVRQNAGSFLDTDTLGMFMLGTAIAGTALTFRDSSNSDDDNVPPIIVDPGPPIPDGPEGPGTEPESPVPPVTPEPPLAAPVTLFDPTEAIVEGFELDGPLVGVAETLQTVTESALTPLVGESFEPQEPGILDGTDGVLAQVVGTLPEDLLGTVGGAAGRPVPMDFNDLLLDQLDVVTDAATVLLVDNPISAVLGTATGPDSSPTGVLNFVDNLVSGEQLGTSVPPITSAAASLPGSLGSVLGSLGSMG